MKRWTDDRRGREGAEANGIQTCFTRDVEVRSGACIHTFFRVETTDMDGFRTAGSYAPSNTHAQSWRKRDIHVWRDRRTRQPSLTSGVRAQARDVPASGLSTCCTCLTQRPRGPVLLVQFQHESVFEASRRNPRPSLSVLCVPDSNHQLSSNSGSSSSSGSTQLVDTFTSATVIWDTIILLCDTL